MIPLSQHAEARMQQRGISENQIELLLQYGNYQHDGHGAEIVHFSKRAKYHLKQQLTHSDFVKAEKDFSVYAVVSGDTLVTVGYRTQRIRR